MVFKRASLMTTHIEGFFNLLFKLNVATLKENFWFELYM